MTRKKAVKYFILVLILLLVLFAYPRKKFHLNEDSISRIALVHNNRLWYMEKENNEEKIHDLVEKMNSMTLYRHFSFFKYGGIMRSIVFYDAQGKVIDGYSTMDAVYSAPL